MNHPFLMTMTVVQLERLWARLRKRVQSDCFGADWLTLGMVNPGLCNSLRAVNTELVRRIQVDLDAIDLP
jgi:hypothetical protein